MHLVITSKYLIVIKTIQHIWSLYKKDYTLNPNSKYVIFFLLEKRKYILKFIFMMTTTKNYWGNIELWMKCLTWLWEYEKVRQWVTLFKFWRIQETDIVLKYDRRSLAWLIIFWIFQDMIQLLCIIVFITFWLSPST